jgi:2-C-methyl-D-erythritol 4-phosphate cytidylyltransferase
MLFILLAGGNSTRFASGQKKELTPIASGQNALATIAQLLDHVPAIDHLHVVYHEQHQADIALAVQCFSRRISFSSAGTTRQESVYLALQATLNYQHQKVLIHDGARPWLTKDLLMRIIDALEYYDAVVPLVPVVDSLKRINSAGMVIEQCDRSEYGLAQTPQGFTFAPILLAHQHLQNQTFSDDVALFYAYHKIQAVAVAGDVTNKKITYQGDLS